MGVRIPNFWAYNAAEDNALMDVYNLPSNLNVANATQLASFEPNIPGFPENGRGVAYDPTDGNIWVSAVNDLAFTGDGFIHKFPALGGPEITRIPEPGGPGGPGIGALDYDPEENVLWAAAYLPIGGQSVFYKLNPADGTVLATISTPNLNFGNDTLAIARPSDLGGQKVILTDAGEFDFTQLLALDINTGAILKTYSLPLTNGVTGIDEDPATGDLIVTTTDFSGTTGVFNLGSAPYNTILSSFFPVGKLYEDISLK